MLDAATLEPVPFAVAVFKGSNVGADADSSGRFYLETNRGFDSLVVSMLGYRSQVVPVSVGATDEIDVELMPDAMELGAFTISRPNENPAFAILREVIARKPVNRPSRLTAYEYQLYHRVRFDLNQFTEKAKRNLLLRPFDYIWDYADTTADGVNYLPILLTESSEEHFYRKQPPEYKQVVHGRRTVKFFKAPRITEFVEDMYIDPDIYENYVVILDRVPSPINDHYKRNYDAQTVRQDDTSLTVSLLPHRLQTEGTLAMAFTGSMFIHDSTYAVVQKVDLAFSIEANVNFVRNYWLRYNYQWLDSAQWFLHKSQVLADFTVVENSKEMTGFFGRKSTEVRNIVMDRPRDDDFYSGVDPVVMDPLALERDSAWWRIARRDALTQEEEELEEMVGRMNSDPKWKRIVSASKLIADGWLPAGPVDIGNAFTFYSYNEAEGSRAKFGLRTNDRFSKRVELSGYVAYGFGDDRWKGGAHAQWHLINEHGKRWSIGGRYRNDQVQQGRSLASLDHVLTSPFRIAGRDHRMMVEGGEGWLERQWFTGCSSRAGVYRMQMAPVGYDFRRTTRAIRYALNNIESPVKLVLLLPGALGNCQRITPTLTAISSS
ncbi:MAG: carboxypeptidase-like regulatory domain-containing protein [Flavobacteriales bacterium]|nr:carboxypeptidase-like regulatory domain-containing protein [Flavobacteriales bacterium]